jgi:hypothetical protein
MKNHHTRLLFAFLLLAVSVRAHFVWVERDAATGAVAAYFGEWSDNLRETQDGYLKLIAAPQAFSADGRELPVAIQHDRLAIAAEGVAGDVRLANLYFPEKGTTLVHYQAKLGRSATTPQFDLELVPSAPGSNTFTLLLRGQPLPDTGVTLFTSSGWNRTFKTGPDGRVTIETPWPGPAVLEVGHVEKSQGDHLGRAYEAIRHVATLTIAVPAR